MARVVVVTGGASGIGLAAARRFSAAGERVAILDRNARAAEPAAATLPAAVAVAVAVACDVADERQVADAIEGIVVPSRSAPMRRWKARSRSSGESMC